MSETVTSLKLASPSGMPMIVIASGDPRDQVADREPPAGEDHPHDVAEERPDAGVGRVHDGACRTARCVKLAMRNGRCPTGS